MTISLSFAFDMVRVSYVSYIGLSTAQKSGIFLQEAYELGIVLYVCYMDTNLSVNFTSFRIWKNTLFLSCCRSILSVLLNIHRFWNESHNFRSCTLLKNIDDDIHGRVKTRCDDPFKKNSQSLVLLRTINWAKQTRCEQARIRIRIRVRTENMNIGSIWELWLYGFWKTCVRIGNAHKYRITIRIQLNKIHDMLSPRYDYFNTWAWIHINNDY